MSNTIAGLYEVKSQIGSGGGGIVYLGHHMRLDKTVVLKADKRKLSIKKEALRREVDLLKDLSHMFIPQVYDFVQENNVVYTVMDYIDGRSLDKVIADQIVLPQKDVIKWACQLLEALVYLHSRPPHGILHGDIKPSNIMLRSNGDICLIDFNIALALGEEGAVKVGFSRGYASPEHYGIDYIQSNIASAGVSSVSTWRKRIQKADKNISLEESQIGSISANRSTTNGNKAVLLDVRSDIYSLGATLYHLISGQRPSHDAKEVVPLDESVCNHEVSAILQKAMAPEPESRYQTAQEMLDAFRNLYKTDIRTIRHKRRMTVSTMFIGVTFLCGGLCAFLGMKQLKQVQESIMLSEYSQNALTQGDVYGAVVQALNAIDIDVTSEAQKALTDALNVYDLSDGFQSLGRLSLSSAPFDMTVSPQKTRMAVVYAYEVAVYDMQTQEQVVVLPICESALSDVVFLDENKIIYAGKDGITAYDVSKNEIQWTGDEATTLALSGNCKVVAAINRDAEYANIYDTVTGEKISTCDFNRRHMSTPVNDIFADAGNSICTLNQDGNLLAVSFSDGSFSIFDLYNTENELIVSDESDAFRYEGGFYGDYFIFSSENSMGSSLILIDAVKGEYIGGMESKDHFLVETDYSGIYLANGNVLESLNLADFEENELAYTNNANVTAFSIGDQYVLVATDDNSFAFYDAGGNLSMSEKCAEPCDFVMMAGDYAIIANRTQKDIRFMKLEKHDDAQLLSYDAHYVHDEARISYDRKTVMLFSYQGFCIYNMDGDMIANIKLPDADSIYDQQFQRKADDSYLEVIWYDGTVRAYSAADGSLISEKKQKAPAKDLYEEFYTDKYRIESALHDVPKVYDRQSGKYIAELEKDAYLTYVTQLDDYIITEYVSAQGDRYGLLLNDKLQKLAYLPNLCDVVDQDTLIFDYESGNLRQCRLYSLQELILLGESYKKN